MKLFVWEMIGPNQEIRRKIFNWFLLILERTSPPPQLITILKKYFFINYYYYETLKKMKNYKFF